MTPLKKASQRLIAGALLVCLSALSCASDNNNAHTTATTVVPPPARQVLRVTARPQAADLKSALASLDPAMRGDKSKPLLIFNLAKGKTFREDEEVVIDFSLANARLKGDGGEYRVRYIVDDDDMQWIDKWEQIGFSGWTAGKHTIRLELIGPDGWPYRNGDYNIVTREIVVSSR